MNSVWMLALTSGATTAATLTVGPSGSADHETLAEAVLAAGAGDVLQLEAHSFDECVVLPDSGLTIEGAGVGETVLVGSTDCEVMLWAEGGDLLLSSVTMSAPGITCVAMAAGSLVLDEVEVTGCGSIDTADIDEDDEKEDVAPRLGGGIQLGAEVDLLVTDSTFTGNLADLGGAIYATGGGSLTISDTVFDRNVAWEDGGAVAVLDGGEVQLDGVQFTENMATIGSGGDLWASTLSGFSMVSSSSWGAFSESSGGALHLADILGPIELDGVDISAAGSRYYGAGLYLTGTGDLSISGSRFVDGFADVHGGGAFVDSSGAVTLSETRFEDNESDSLAGGIVVANAASVLISDCDFLRNLTQHGGGGALLVKPGQADIVNSRFLYNRVDSVDQKLAGWDVPSWGGGLMLTIDGGDTSISDTSFCGNDANGGSGLGIDRQGNDEADVTIASTIFAQNGDPDGNDGDGAAMRVEASGEILLQDVTVVGNRADGPVLYLAAPQATLVNTVLAHNSDGVAIDTSVGLEMTYGALYDNVEGDLADDLDPADVALGLVTADPDFAAYDRDAACEDIDLRPSSSSPLVDAGDPERFDDDGSRSDIGALDAAPSGKTSLVGLETLPVASAGVGAGASGCGASGCAAVSADPPSWLWWVALSACLGGTRRRAGSTCGGSA